MLFAVFLSGRLLRTSISIVATGDGAARSSGSESDARDQAISAALVLALAIGVLQSIFFLLFTPLLISGMGAPVGSSMRPTAISYLRVRALGMPAATLWLVSNGIFRGLGDTRTPLAWALLFSALNAALDPIFIFPLKLGAAGAAAGTALSQSIALVGLLKVLHKRTGVRVSPAALLAPRNLKTLAPALASYGKAGVLVFFRTWGKVAACEYFRIRTRIPCCSLLTSVCSNLYSDRHLLFARGGWPGRRRLSCAPALFQPRSGPLSVMRVCGSRHSDATRPSDGLPACRRRRRRRRR